MYTVEGIDCDEVRLVVVVVVAVVEAGGGLNVDELTKIGKSVRLYNQTPPDPDSSESQPS